MEDNEAAVKEAFGLGEQLMEMAAGIALRGRQAGGGNGTGAHVGPTEI
jgi:hypothetical protein